LGRRTVFTQYQKTSDLRRPRIGCAAHYITVLLINTEDREKGAFRGGVRRKAMLSYLFYVVSLVGVNSGFVNPNQNSELMGGKAMTGEATGGLVVKMGPVMNMRVSDVHVVPSHQGEDLPAVTPKGSLFESFSKSRLYAIRYGK